MADSLNTTNLSRRTILGTGIAAAGALAVAAVPAIASTGSDCKLLQLCRNWHRLERAQNRALNNLGAAEEAFWAVVVPKPTILLEGFEAFPGDTIHAAAPELFQCDYAAHSDKVPYLHRPQLALIAEGHIRVEAQYLPGGKLGDHTLISVPQEARDRAKACLAALDEWEADEKARRTEVDSWEATQDRIHDLQGKVSEQIADLPAQTMQGLKAKLTIVSAEPFYAQDTGIAASALADTRRIDASARLNPPLTAA